MPLREEMVRLRRALETTVLGAWKFGVVGLGVDDWLFYLPSLGSQLGSIEEVRTALDRVDSFVAEETFTARLIITVGPDKHTIYPEYLSPPLWSLAERATEQRQLLHDWFEGPGPSERLPLWDRFLAERQESDALLYEPQGSHHSSLGSMILARAMIDALDPSLWHPEDVTYTTTLRYQADLATLAGFTGVESDFDWYEVVRPGVELVSFAHNGIVLPGQDRATAEQGPAEAAARYVSRSVGAPLIGGRTLIIHDSYVYSYLRPALRQFFEDVTFIAFGDIPTSDDLLEALSDFDLVYVESAEREFIAQANRLFAPSTPPGTHLLREISERGFSGPAPAPGG